MEVDDRRQANSLAESVGLQDFPSNVLINIFAKACPSPYDRRLLFGLSLVCNKFAGVLRQPSVLWNVMLLSLPRQAPSLPSAKAALDQLCLCRCMRENHCAPVMSTMIHSDCICAAPTKMSHQQGFLSPILILRSFTV